MPWRPNLPVSLPLGLAISGAALAAVSFFVPWQRVSATPSVPGPVGIEGEAAIYGFIFLTGLLAMFAIATVANFAPPRPQRIAALAGLGLGLAMLLVLVALASRLTMSSPFSTSLAGRTQQPTYGVGWGLYAGMVSTVAFGLSMFTITPVRLRRPAEPLPEPDAIDLEVRVESI